MAHQKATLLYQITHDHLTLLPNRILLRERLEQALHEEQPESRSIALLVMDLNGFKEINHTLGHQTGDILLQQVGQRLKESLNEDAMVARLGGDEFAVLLTSGPDASNAAAVATKILTTLEEPFELNKLQVNVHASIGIALSPEHGNDADGLFQKADIAMYVAKRKKNGFAVYTSEQNHNNRRQLSLMAELRRAMTEDQLFLVYQPKINLRTGRIYGVEALVRWKHPALGIIRPARFISLAEQTGLIMPLTLWVLHEALRQCHAWQKMGLDVTTAVNLSVWNLQSQELPDQISGLLKTCAVEPDLLQLEITESAIMMDPARSMETLKRINHMGLKFSIDDFGTGYSSLAYLKKLPVQEIKIDRSFVCNMATDRDDLVIVRSTVDLGHNLGLHVVGEGVEDQETLERLSELDCDAAQGFYISRPLPATELTHWLFQTPDKFKQRLPRQLAYTGSSTAVYKE
jgi:diguanylate cyclase (GGDEF)-like protein